MDREERIKQRAPEIWEREGRPDGRQQEHWDQAVKEIESEGSEAERGPVTPDPLVGAGLRSGLQHARWVAASKCSRYGPSVAGRVIGISMHKTASEPG
ncbi:DUF2934 domain-containing protein [Mesorhizobium sp. B2-7-1]|uniref:DUF2934 domain-containing protein n=1 Tax=Mesorhizobium sp. B2-7-1 TaxID=2589909 RepID=UPI0011267871|nr:DUF2934 domain-containing protein [Mesorhizobium sp. B2-7-1]TPJ74707.1 DUF2934 domain-containing protein [Mesorhizobium sp. B2-7-1]